MKKLYIILFVVLLAVTLFGVMRPSYGSSVDELSGRVRVTETANPETYRTLVIRDQAHNSFLVNEAVKCVMYENDFPFTSHTFGYIETEQIIKVLNDSSNYRWGEIGTPHYDRCILFYDKAERLIGCIDISLDGEVDMFPYRAVIKWGLLSDKGWRELMLATRTK